jgi:Spy/CpxP family protein refolding chaperone
MDRGTYTGSNRAPVHFGKDQVMTLRALVLVLAACAFAVPVHGDAPTRPHAGQQAWTIKALSPEDVAALLNAEGVGIAKAAELKGYPGPVHVLTLAKELKLTTAQQQQIQAIYDRMKAGAKPLGAELVERERVLDQLFSKG